jgi:predicted ATPase
LQRCGIVPAEVGAYLLHLLGFPGGTAHLDTCNAEVHKARTLQTLQQLTITSSRPGPLILAVENLHWIDPFSAEYLRVLVEGLAGVPLLLLVTYRPGYRPPWMAHSYATQLVLSPLGSAGSREVIQGALGTTPVAEPLVKTVLAKAEGNPFFLEELVQVLVEQGAQAAPHIPETVWAVLAERIDPLPSVAKWVLQVAAVIGRHVPEALLEALATGSKAALQEGLRALVSAELLCAMHRTSPLHYTFKHALTQEVVYQSLLQSTRQALHHRVVQVLAAQFPEIVETQPEVLAHHVTKAGMNGASHGLLATRRRTSVAAYSTCSRDHSRESSARRTWLLTPLLKNGSGSAVATQQTSPLQKHY